MSGQSGEGKAAEGQRSLPECPSHTRLEQKFPKGKAMRTEKEPRCSHRLLQQTLLPNTATAIFLAPTCFH